MRFKALSMLDLSELTSEAKGDNMDKSLKISSDCLSPGSLWKSSKLMIFGGGMTTSKSAAPEGSRLSVSWIVLFSDRGVDLASKLRRLSIEAKGGARFQRSANEEDVILCSRPAAEYYCSSYCSSQQHALILLLFFP